MNETVDNNANKLHILEDRKAFRKSLSEGGEVSEEALRKYWKWVDEQIEKTGPVEVQRIKEILGLE